MTRNSWIFQEELTVNGNLLLERTKADKKASGVLKILEEVRKLE
jgi:hypothetical protein